MLVPHWAWLWSPLITFRNTREILLSVVISATIFFEIVGPVLAKMALQRNIYKTLAPEFGKRPAIAPLIWHLATKWFTPLRLYTLFSPDKKIAATS